MPIHDDCTNNVVHLEVYNNFVEKTITKDFEEVPDTVDNHVITAFETRKMTKKRVLSEVDSSTNYSTNIKTDNLLDNADTSKKADVTDVESSEYLIDSASVSSNSSLECAICIQLKRPKIEDKIIICSVCDVVVHPTCYNILDEDINLSSDAWICDGCACNKNATAMKCSYCGTSDGGIMKFLNNKQNKDLNCNDSCNSVQGQHCLTDKDIQNREIAHILCLNWDILKVESDMIDISLPTSVPPYSNSIKCCVFCNSTSGIRIQCRALNCNREFHAMCAHKAKNGVLEQYLAYYPAYQAYCNRHHNTTDPLNALLTLITSDSMKKFIGKTVARQFLAIYNKAKSQQSVIRDKHDMTLSLDAATTIVNDLLQILTPRCYPEYKHDESDKNDGENDEKSVRKTRSGRTPEAKPPSKSQSDPSPINCLQVVQLIRSHIPHIQLLYTSMRQRSASSLIALDLQLPFFKKNTPVSSNRKPSAPSLNQLLQKTFDPVKHMGKHGGLLDTCGVLCTICGEPFYQRQKVYFCTGKNNTSNDKVVHAQHWLCKGDASALPKLRREKRQKTSQSIAVASHHSFPLVVDGVPKIISAPPDLSNIQPDSIVCGVTSCRAPIDLRSVLISPPIHSSNIAVSNFSNSVDNKSLLNNSKDVQSLNHRILPAQNNWNANYVPPQSSFVNGGAFINIAGSMVDKMPELAGTPRTEVPPRKARQKGRAQHASNSATIVSDRETKSKQPDTTKISQLSPPSVDRLNVKITTEWLAIVAQLIRLVMKCSHQVQNASEEVTQGVSPDAQQDAAQKASEKVSQSISLDAQQDAQKDASEEVSHNVFQESSQEVSLEVSKNMSKDAPPSTEVKSDSNTKLDIRNSGIVPMATLIIDHFQRAKSLVQKIDPYVHTKLSLAEDWYKSDQSNAPTLGLLRRIVHEYTHLAYIKHKRSAEKIALEEKKRKERAEITQRQKERAKLDRKAEIALKNQLAAMRRKMKKHKLLEKEKEKRRQKTPPNSKDI